MTTPKEQAIKDALKACGSTDAQADDGAIILAGRVSVGNHGEYLLGAVPLDNVTEFKTVVAELKPHLLPASANDLAVKAFVDGNMTSRTQLVREVGLEEANRLAKAHGLGSVHDPRRARTPSAEQKERANNPWSDHPNNVDERGRYTANALTRQAALVKANLSGAAEIAKAVGSKIGDTHAKRRAA